MKVITFGEIMLRLAPHGHLRFSQANEFIATYGGGEANVAVSLANYHVDTAFVTKLPSHTIGECALQSLRKYGVDTSFIARGGDRLGIYYLEKGASQRASQVIYDRAHSSICSSTLQDYPWDEIFKDADWFHFTGITPALGENLAQLCNIACIAAKKANCTISCDLNYRKKLWSQEQANNVMEPLMQYVDVCIANEEDAYHVFKMQAEHSDVQQGTLHKDGYINVAKQIAKRFACKAVAITLRESTSADDNNWGALLYQSDTAYFSKTYPIHIVDRVGGGDSFAAGLIYAMRYQNDPQYAISFAVAASCLKHTIEGDFNHVSIEEIQHLIDGDGSGRVQR